MSSKVLGLPVVKHIAKNRWVTLEDLQEFKQSLLLEIQAILTNGSISQSKRWLKTYQVKELLGISSGTLQTLRDNGTVPFSKIGGIIYYDSEEINKVVEQQKKGFRKNRKADP